MSEETNVSIKLSINFNDVDLESSLLNIRRKYTKNIEKIKTDINNLIYNTTKNFINSFQDSDTSPKSSHVFWEMKFQINTPWEKIERILRSQKDKEPEIVLLNSLDFLSQGMPLFQALGYNNIIQIRKDENLKCTLCLDSIIG